MPITPANPPRTKVARPPFTVFVLIAVLLAAVAAFTLWRGDSAPSAAPGSAELIDARGRAVTIDGPVDHLAIDDARYLVALGLLHPDPVSLLVAWPHDVNRLGEDTYRQFLQKSPELAELTTIASSAGEFNVETLLGAAPEVALLSLESGVTEAQVQQLEAAGIRVVFVDFFVKPFENLEPSLRILGRLTGREQQAESFIVFRADRMARIEQAVADLPEEYRPTVFVEAHAGMGADCCNSPGRGNIGDYLTFVGGHNIGSDAIQQSFGKLNLEYVISRDPDVYIATGGPHLEKAGGLVLGPGYDQAQSKAALTKVAGRRGISRLTAVREGRTHGFSHHLINSPLDIIAIEAFAKWIHPDRFGDLDPEATLAEINERFLAVPYQGTYWVDLQ